MIKKYEKLKKEMKQKYAEEDEFIVDCILDDLHSVEAHTLCNKILKQIDKAIINDDPDGALTWARVIQTLPE